MLSQAVWMTLFGLSLLVIGGFVLWVYGTQTPQAVKAAAGPEADSIKKFHTTLVQWFFMFGIFAVVLGIGSMLTAAIMVL